MNRLSMTSNFVALRNNEMLSMIVSGLDVDKSRVWVHVLDEKGNSLFVADVARNHVGLTKLRRYMVRYHVTKVVMESTSTYWIPIHLVLKRFVSEICVVNAYQLKVLGKHKTDKRDAELLATWGLLNVLQASYVPDLVIHELRQLVRSRISTIENRNAAISQVKTLLEGICPGITTELKNFNSSFAQLYFGAWGKDGRSFMEFVKSVDHKSTRNALLKRQEVLSYWWNRPLPPTSQHLVDMHFRRIQFYTKEIEMLDDLLEEKTSESREMVKAVKLISTIPGIGFTTAITVAAELGSVERFDNARQAAASTGLTPKLNGSGGRTRAGRITKHGPKSVRRAMYIACRTVIRNDERYKEFFERVKSNGNGMIALVALSRKLVELCWTLWATNKPYRAAATA